MFNDVYYTVVNRTQISQQRTFTTIQRFHSLFNKPTKRTHDHNSTPNNLVTGSVNICHNMYERKSLSGDRPNFESWWLYDFIAILRDTKLASCSIIFNYVLLRCLRVRAYMCVSGWEGVYVQVCVCVRACLLPYESLCMDWCQKRQPLNTCTKLRGHHKGKPTVYFRYS